MSSFLFTASQGAHLPPKCPFLRTETPRCSTPRPSPERARHLAEGLQEQEDDQIGPKCLDEAWRADSSDLNNPDMFKPHWLATSAREVTGLLVGMLFDLHIEARVIGPLLKPCLDKHPMNGWSLQSVCSFCAARFSTFVPCNDSQFHTIAAKLRF